MTEQDKHRVATTVGFMTVDKLSVIVRYLEDKYLYDHDYDHEMWLLYMGLIESYQFQRS